MIYFRRFAPLLFCVFILKVFGEDNTCSEPYSPPDIPRDVTIIRRPHERVPTTKKTIVIDGSVLGIDGASTASLRAESPGPKWWEGFETAYTNEEVMQALFKRVEAVSNQSLDTRVLSDLSKEKDFGALYEKIGDLILFMRFRPDILERKVIISDIACCAALVQREALGFPQAEKFLLAARKLNPENQVALLLLGETYAEQGRFDQALNVISPLLSSSYFPVRLSALSSRIYQNKNQISRAIYHWNNVLERIKPRASDQFRLRFLESERYVQRNFHTYATSRYVIKYEPVFEKDRERIISPILTMVDEARWRLNRRMKASPRDKTMIVIYSADTFHSLLGGELSHLEAFFNFEDSKLRLSVGRDQETNIRLLRLVIFHEYVHFLIHYITRGRMRSRWLHEGLATYFEWKETGVDRLEKISPPPVQEDFRLEELLTDEITLQGYRLARNVVEFLVRRYGEKQLLAFLAAIGNGGTMSRNLEHHFGLSYEELDEMIRSEFR